jgi:hypothetical protein
LTIQGTEPLFFEFLEEHYVLVLRKAIIEQLGTHGKLGTLFFQKETTTFVWW